jgi:hypothetical protein
VFDNWRFLRFLLPTWPLIMLGTGALIHALYRTGRLALRVVAVGTLIVALDAHLGFVSDRDILVLARSEARYPVVARAVRGITENDSVILTMQHSGTVRYYAGRLTLRYDLLESDWLDRAVAWLHERGVEAYLLLDDWERVPFEEHFAGQRALENLDARARLTYEGPSNTTLFALSPDARTWPAIPLPAVEGPVFGRPASDQTPSLELKGTALPDRRQE